MHVTKVAMQLNSKRNKFRERELTFTARQILFLKNIMRVRYRRSAGERVFIVAYYVVTLFGHYNTARYRKLRS